MRYIESGVEKIDASSILTSRPSYTEDLAPQNALVVKVLRSHVSFAKIKHIDVKKALKVPGIECIFTFKDVPKNYFTLAGQSYPEPSPYDRLILDEYVRYVGDGVAIVAGKDNDCVDHAMRLIKVKYETLKPAFDFEEAENSGVVIHPEHPKNNLPQAVVKYDYDRNIAGEIFLTFGKESVDQVYQMSPVKIESTYRTQAQSQAMMETFRSYTYLDSFGRLNVLTSTQVPFHIKRQLSVALGIPAGKIRVKKPRVGGGFGAKQSSESEIYPAFVTWKTGKPAMIVYSRKDTFRATNSRHPMRLQVRIGAEEDGRINVIDMDVLSDQGAYGNHAWTTLRLAGEKSMPLYNKVKCSRFHGKVVYTNKMPAGAFRGYGATQGIYALESAVNELAKKLNMDPCDLHMKNILQEGEITTSFGKEVRSCTLDRCISRGKELIRWNEIYPYQDLGDGKVRSVGMALAMQGSGIAAIDSANATIQLNEDGDYTLLMSATDCGTGADTILTQMAAEVLMTDIQNIATYAADTDVTPFDPGSYASSGTYTTGRAVVDAAHKMVKKIKKEAGKKLNVPADELTFNGSSITAMDLSKHISIKDLASQLTRGADARHIIANGYFGNDDSPPPYMAGFCQVLIDRNTGEATVEKYVGVVDCGTVINENLARIQTEGGIVQGIGLALYEDVHYDEKGQFANHSFMTYRIPARQDIHNIEVEFEPSYEPTGPFGAKSIGEIVINTPAPAIHNALMNGLGICLYKLPMTQENIYFALLEKERD